MLAVLPLLMVALAVPAYAQASISLGGDAVIKSSKVLSVPITASCAPVGQETTFILVTVTQPRSGGAFVEGEASLSAIISDCVTEDGSFNCTTQAFIPQTTTTLVRR